MDALRKTWRFSLALVVILQEHSEHNLEPVTRVLHDIFVRGTDVPSLAPFDFAGRHELHISLQNTLWLLTEAGQKQPDASFSRTPSRRFSIDLVPQLWSIYLKTFVTVYRLYNLRTINFIGVCGLLDKTPDTTSRYAGYLRPADHVAKQLCLLLRSGFEGLTREDALLFGVKLVMEVRTHQL